MALLELFGKGAAVLELREEALCFVEGRSAGKRRNRDVERLRELFGQLARAGEGGEGQGDPVERWVGCAAGSFSARLLQQTQRFAVEAERCQSLDFERELGGAASLAHCRVHGA